MVRIELLPVSNGFLKISTDDNHNGTKTLYTDTKVYTIPNSIEEVKIFVEDICNDLGISLDNGDSRVAISVNVEYDIEDIDEAIKYHQEEIKILKNLKKSKNGK